MKKFFYFIFLTFIFLFFSTVVYLSTIGVETSKFNNLIVKEIKKKNTKIDIELKKIKIKLDIKKLQLFLSTSSPKIIYQNIKIPITKIKVYTKINKIFAIETNDKKIIYS